jgi:hypothetical protein
MNLKTKDITLGLRIVEVKNDHGFYHVFARPVTIGNVRAEGTLAYDYVQGTDSYDTYNGLYLSGLLVRSQGGNSDTRRHLYGFEPVFEHTYQVDMRDAQRMLKTLATIDRKMEKLAGKFGRPSSFGTYLSHLAHVLGVKRFVFDSPRDTSADQILDIKSGAYKVDHFVNEWASAEHGIEAAS